MQFRISKILGGVLYIDEDIICIKRDRKFLDVYQFLPSYQILFTIELARRTNKVGRYSQGIFYYQDRFTHFHTLSNKKDGKDEGRFYYRLDSVYKAYTTLENRGCLNFYLESEIEVPILQQGGYKLFLDEGVIQAQQIGDGTGVIVYNSLSNKGAETWRHHYSELTESNKANLHSQILNSYNKLFFVITGNDKKGLFVLDIETGDLLKKFENLCYEIFKDGGYIYTTKFENILCRINTRTLELEEWDCNALIVKNDFHSIHDHRCNVIDGKFCFTQSLGDNKSKLGVLDWKKKELVYKYNFEPDNGAIGSIQVNNTRMFVHTQDNTLHIFEKEEKSI